MGLAMTGEGEERMTTWAGYVEKHPKLQRLEPFIAATGCAENPIVIRTATALKAAEARETIIPATYEFRSLEDRKAATARQDALSVGLAQPHRRGSDDTRLGTPLGRFCAAPRGAGSVPLGDHCWHAGERYAEIVRDAKTAQGFDVHGWAPSDNAVFSLTPEQIEARRDLAVSRLREADAVLRAAVPRLPRIMERLCYDQLEPGPYDGDAIIHGLVLLAIEWGLLKAKFGG